MALELTVESLKAAMFRGPTVFGDGAKGLAFQEHACVDEPRFGYTWRRENRKDRGRTFYTVDGDEVPTLEEACRRLALPPDPNSRAEYIRRDREEHVARKAAGESEKKE